MEESVDYLQNYQHFQWDIFPLRYEIDPTVHLSIHRITHRLLHLMPIVFLYQEGAAMGDWVE